MKSNSGAQKSASEIAQEIFKVTKVESFLDKEGKVKHLIAKLSRHQFEKLYSQETVVTIFIQGYWLQLLIKGNKLLFLNRENNLLLNLEIISNDYINNKLKISYHGKTLGIFSSKKILLTSNPKTTDEYFFLAKSAIKILHKISNTKNEVELNNIKYPVIQIIPLEKKETHFNKNLVNLQ